MLNRPHMTSPPLMPLFTLSAMDTSDFHFFLTVVWNGGRCWAWPSLKRQRAASALQHSPSIPLLPRRHKGPSYTPPLLRLSQEPSSVGPSLRCMREIHLVTGQSSFILQRRWFADTFLGVLLHPSPPTHPAYWFHLSDGDMLGFFDSLIKIRVNETCSRRAAEEHRVFISTCSYHAGKSTRSISDSKTQTLFIY